MAHSLTAANTSYGMGWKCLWGVPNTAFTEGFAFTFQDKADFILGRKAAVGQPISAEPMLEDAERACGRVLGSSN